MEGEREGKREGRGGEVRKHDAGGGETLNTDEESGGSREFLQVNF